MKATGDVDSSAQSSGERPVGGDFIRVGFANSQGVNDAQDVIGPGLAGLIVWADASDAFATGGGGVAAADGGGVERAAATWADAGDVGSAATAGTAMADMAGTAGATVWHWWVRPWRVR